MLEQANTQTPLRSWSVLDGDVASHGTQNGPRAACPCAWPVCHLKSSDNTPHTLRERHKNGRHSLMRCAVLLPKGHAFRQLELRHPRSGSHRLGTLCHPVVPGVSFPQRGSFPGRAGHQLGLLAPNATGHLGAARQALSKTAPHAALHTPPGLLPCLSPSAHPTRPRLDRRAGRSEIWNQSGLACASQLSLGLAAGGSTVPEASPGWPGSAPWLWDKLCSGTQTRSKP